MLVAPRRDAKIGSGDEPNGTHDYMLLRYLHFKSSR